MAAVLTSWKEIASYLGKGVRTVQRWEREMDLPVRRPKPKEKQIVLAFPDELDDWVRQQTVRSRSERPAQVSGNQLTSEILADTMRLHRYREPLKTTNRESLDRMHALLDQMVQNTQTVRDRAEHLLRNMEQFHKNRDRAPVLVSSHRAGSLH